MWLRVRNAPIGGLVLGVPTDLHHVAQVHAHSLLDVCYHDGAISEDQFLALQKNDAILG